MDGINKFTGFDGFTNSDENDEDFFAAAVADEEGDEPGGEQGGDRGDSDDDDDEDEREAPNKKPKEKEEVLEDLFSEAEEQDEDEDDSPEKPKNKKPKEGESTTTALNTLNFLKEKGLIDVEAEEGDEINEENAGDYLEDAVETMVESRLEDLFANVPDVVKELNSFVLNGGDPFEYIKNLSAGGAKGLSEGMDMTVESNQELIHRNALEDQGYDKEYIDAQIEYLKDSKKLASLAGPLYQKWEDKVKADKETTLANQAKYVENQKNKKKELKNKVASFLNETAEVAGFAISKNDKRDLPGYMTDMNVKTENGKQITSLQRDLFKVLASPVGSVQIAKLLKSASENGELSFKEIKEDSDSKAAKDLKDNIRRNKNSFKNKSDGGKPKHLADYFTVKN